MIALSAVCMDTNSQCYFINQLLNNAWCNKGHWLTGRPYLAMTASNVLELIKEYDKENLIKGNFYPYLNK